MLTSVKGVYRNGRVELAEHPANLRDETLVIVTFVEAEGVDLPSRGISETEAAELRDRLASFCRRLEQPGNGDLRRL